MIKLKIFLNLCRGTYLWSQTSDTDWYRKTWELPNGYYRLVLTWEGGWSCKISNWLYAGWTLTGFAAPSFFIMDDTGDKQVSFNEKMVIILTGILFHILNPVNTMKKVLYPTMVQHYNIEEEDFPQ